MFFICPTVYGGSEGAENMPMEDQETKESFLGATNMEKGIYDDACRFFAPYYRQAGLYVYGLPEEERGALKVPDVSPEDYPPGLSIFSEGIYHLYDYQFFYRNLEENVGVRLEAYAEERAMDQAA